MANLETDVMRALLRISEVAKNQAMTDVHAAAVQGRIFKPESTPGESLSSIDKIVRAGVDQGIRNGMREMTATLRPYIRRLQQAEIDKQG
jgi:hypothetical protein